MSSGVGEARPPWCGSEHRVGEEALYETVLPGPDVHTNGDGNI